ncbi:hypothetical protein [Gloeothece verrucosa]|uniref:Uncharacterized protein n=1 Tax=Gloeothece verrucosa (strain PCC 7822) TaxID=497965 RepID=E0UG02_GLOV7|nr:hypothetical protein Cyan7822_2410 [Gloeothece verrucosa PCC 7822]
MPKPYISELRQKIIQAIDLDGMKKIEVDQIFPLSRKTINLCQHTKKPAPEMTKLSNHLGDCYIVDRLKKSIYYDDEF